MDSLSWQGADNGREGLLRADKWFKTLSVLGDNEGESITNYSSVLYRDLFQEMPDESWLGKDGQRSLFRDYQKSWTSLGVLRPTNETDQIVELTDKGRALVESKNIEEFFRIAIDGYTELWEVEGLPTLVSPYEIISQALLLFPDGSNVIEVRELENKAEMIAAVIVSRNSLLKFVTGPTNTRRFRSYLILLENAGAITRLANATVSILDRDYLKSITRDGVLAASPDSIVMEVDWEEGYPEELPEDIAEDFRKRKLSERVVREGQSKFAKALKEIYSNTCCITGATEKSILQAAHIMPYRGRQTNFPSNGLLLAQDIHTLFDKGRLLINPDSLCVEFPESMNDIRYLKYAGRKIMLPGEERYQPNHEALVRRYELSLSA